MKTINTNFELEFRYQYEQGIKQPSIRSVSGMDVYSQLYNCAIFLSSFLINVFKEHIIKNILSSAREEPSGPARYVAELISIYIYR